MGVGFMADKEDKNIKGRFLDATEMGNTSFLTEQENVNNIYAEIYPYMKTEMANAEASGKPVKFIIADYHLAYRKMNDGRVVEVADNDAVLVALCVTDISHKLGVRNFLIESNQQDIDIIMKFLDHDQTHDIILTDPISHIQYIEYIKQLGRPVTAGDPYNALFGRMLEVAEDSSLTRDEKKIRINELNKKREEGMLEELHKTQEPQTGSFGAAHVPDLYDGLKDDFYVVPILGSSLKHHPTTGIMEELEGEDLKEMIEKGRIKGFVVQGESRATNDEAISMVQKAAAEFELQHSLQPSAPKPGGSAPAF